MLSTLKGKKRNKISLLSEDCDHFSQSLWAGALNPNPIDTSTLMTGFIETRIIIKAIPRKKVIFFLYFEIENYIIIIEMLSWMLFFSLRFPINIILVIYSLINLNSTLKQCHSTEHQKLK